jgi:4-amino-4-deoxy-L-arabinose transferase-like glycosyltransferase
VLGRIPRVAWVCALVACLNAVSWSFITPPFQAPDETDHFAYVEQLVKTGRLPSSSAETYSADEAIALKDLHEPEVSLQPGNHTISSRAEQQTLQEELTRVAGLNVPATGAAGVAASQPPLYYALEAIPYSLGLRGTVLGRLELMRLLSALMAGLTALFAFLFLREALPRVPWAWTVGGLGVALAPMLGFMSGAVNPDAMLCAVSAAAFYCLARAFRHGLTPKLAIAIGAVTAVGFLTKLNFIGLAPGVLLGLIVLSIRAARTSGHAAYRSLALALAIAGSPIALDIVVNQLSNHPTLGLVSSAASSAVQHNSVLSEISYIWQLYLPRLPLMHDDFPHILTTRVLWFNGLVGRYGWSEVLFPPWVDDIALIPAGVIAILCTRTLLTSRAVLRHRLGELIVYFVMVAGLLILIGAASYSLFPEEAAAFPEPRYLLPMLPLLGAVLALASRGAGRRWGPAAGALIVVLFLAHDLFSQLQVIARYYG